MQHCGGFLTLITDNGKQFKNSCKKAASEIGNKYQFLILHHPQSNSISQFHSCLKAHVFKHLHSELNYEDTLKLLLFSFIMLPGIHYKEGHILPTFSVESL